MKRGHVGLVAGIGVLVVGVPVLVVALRGGQSRALVAAVARSSAPTVVASGPGPSAGRLTTIGAELSSGGSAAIADAVAPSVVAGEGLGSLVPAGADVRFLPDTLRVSGSAASVTAVVSAPGQGGVQFTVFLAEESGRWVVIGTVRQ